MEAVFVPNRSQLAQIHPAIGMAYLSETFGRSSGRNGLFRWRSGDFAAQVSADRLNGVFVQSTFAPPTAGAWVRDHEPGRVEASWWGATFNYEPNVSTPNDVTSSLQAAIDYVHTPSAFAAFSKGGEVLLPRGYGYFTKEINVKDGVTVVGQGIEAGGLIWAGNNDVAHPIWIGSKDRTASFSCGLRNMQIRSIQDARTTRPDLDLIYTESAQHTGGLEKVKIMGGGRICFNAVVGWGGASTLLFRDVETHNTAGINGAPNVPQIILDYAPSFIEADNIIVQGGTNAAVPRGLLIKSGYVHIRGFHSEWVRDAIIVAQTTPPHHVSVRGATGGNGVTNLISSAPTDRTGQHIVIGQSVRNGAANLYRDYRAGGPTVTNDIFADTIY